MSHVTRAELAVLRALWDRGGSRVRELCDQLYPREAPPTTPRSRSCSNGSRPRASCAGTSGTGSTSSRGGRSARLVAQRLRDTAEQLCGGSLTPLLTHLVGSAKLTREELASLRELVDERDS